MAALDSLMHLLSSAEVAPSPELATVPAKATSNGSSIVSGLIAGVVAALVAGVAAVLQRRTGKESAAAAERAARAAEASVELNEKTASGVAVRAEAEARSKRYQDAASQLGNPSPAVRLAGVYALAHLADEWLEQQQSCIDVLCAYLRMPWPEEADDAFRAERHVRRAVTQAIGQRIRTDAPAPGWCERDFDFSDARLVDLRLEKCTFRGTVSFAGACFEGECVLSDLVFQKGASFTGCRFYGRIKVDHVEGLDLHQVDFRGSRIEKGAEVIVIAGVSAADRARPATLDDLWVAGLLAVKLPTSRVQQPALYLDRADIAGGRVEITKPLNISKDKTLRHVPKVVAREWTIGDASEIDIPQGLIDAGTVGFSYFFTKPSISPTAKLSFQFAEAEA